MFHIFEISKKATMAIYFAPDVFNVHKISEFWATIKIVSIRISHTNMRQDSAAFKLRVVYLIKIIESDTLQALSFIWLFQYKVCLYP